ncbi:hypothetical protein [Novosphingobium sp. KN65.2]|uniref:hypothetical protein n=1 Tax=Novosphingobium sp. KN65.2 TaxID=1478134 RepID=UPI000AA881C5|nr:hypothetical protein [Novosphingobium sp. KN65.2]
MIRRLCTAMLPLLLAACFQSENPHFERSVLVQPADLLGQRLNIDDAPSSIAYDLFRRDKNDGVIWVTDRKGAETTHNQVIPLAGPDSFLFVMNTDEETVQYAVLERLKSRAWGMSTIELSRETPFADQNVAYARSIAARHGLSLHVGDGTTIESPLTADAVLALFRDPEFLGALSMQRSTILLAPGARAAPGEELRLDPDSMPPALVGVNLQPGSLGTLGAPAKPEGLAGRYLQANPYHEDGLLPTTVRLLDTGQFEVSTKDSRRVLLSLFPFNEAEGQYLAIKDLEYADEDNPSHAVSIEYVVRTSDGWIFQSVTVQECVARSAIVAMHRDLMNRAALRHGLTWNGSDLSGLKSIGQLAALFGDGQFTSGLTVDDEHVERLFSRESIQSKLLDE